MARLHYFEKGCEKSVRARMWLCKNHTCIHGSWSRAHGIHISGSVMEYSFIPTINGIMCMCVYMCVCVVCMCVYMCVCVCVCRDWGLQSTTVLNKKIIGSN